MAWKRAGWRDGNLPGQTFCWHGLSCYPCLWNFLGMSVYTAVHLRVLKEPGGLSAERDGNSEARRQLE